jgi:hypothetical protein
VKDPGQSDIEVVMEDGSWRKGRAVKPGRGNAQEVGGDGWMFVQHEDLDWWAAPDEWRER